MQSAQTYLEVVKGRGERRHELKRVYRNLKSRELFLMAYGNLYANAGAMTRGVDPQDTVDGMTLQRIDDIINSLNSGEYRWQPVRRTHIPKKDGKRRPLGVPGWKDKLMQEVIRLVLTAYYEPQFSKKSHGFRPGRGCHTALKAIRNEWHGVKWFIEGDIQGCFDNIDHAKLLEILGRKIKDQRLLKLLRDMLDAGYMEGWKKHATLSGVPQGGIISPLLTNIFLNELDNFVEQTLIPHYTRGSRRRFNPEYARHYLNQRNAAKRGDMQRYRELRKRMQQIPSRQPDDPNYRRLKYVRYADDVRRVTHGFIPIPDGRGEEGDLWVISLTWR